jgi:PHS family inorganic phosphate transporter-like MFS transporter
VYARTSRPNQIYIGRQEGVQETYNILPEVNYRKFLSFNEKANFRWYNFHVLVVATIGFFADANTIFSNNFCAPILGFLFWSASHSDPFRSTKDTAVNVATFGASHIGQLGFGNLADIVGRKRMYGLGLITIIIATLAQLWSSPPISASPIGGPIMLQRVFLGIGIGQCFLLLIVKYSH